MNNRKAAVLFFLGVLIVSVAIAIIEITEYSAKDNNWWTRVLCNNGEIRDDMIYQTCINETGEYRAKFYGKKYYGNTTSSFSKYWHMKEYDVLGRKDDE